MPRERTIVLPKTGGVVYHIFRVMMRCSYWLLGGRSSGRELVPRSDAVQIIFACNHTGRIEPFWVHVCAPRRKISIVSKNSLFKNPFMRWFMNAVGCIPINREEVSKTFVRTCQENFRAGNDLLMFPQGTRCTTFTRESIRPGVARFANSNEVIVMPVHFWTWHNPATGARQPLHVKFGKPIYPRNAAGILKSATDIEEEMFRAIKAMEVAGLP